MASGLLDPEFLIGVALANDRFKIVAKIGSGSMGFVYRAFDRRLETEVVVKVPRKEKLQDDGMRERFRRESRLLVQLQHPHIVRILDAGLQGTVPFVVMQYLSGGSLLDRMQDRNGRPSAIRIASIREWLPQVAQALDFAHQRQIVHRDVKPANILFDEAGNAFLCDFGLTRILYGDPEDDGAFETGAGMVAGTPSYVAPEIVLGEGLDGRADQYSLGITLYHALLGTSPMLGKSPSATMVNQTRKVLPLLSEVRKAVSESTARALARAISKSPGERFATCSEFAQSVLAGLTGSPEGAAATAAGESTARIRAAATNGGDPAPVVSQAKRKTAAKGSRRPVPMAGFDAVCPCPSCHRDIQLKAEFAGRCGRCRHCNVRVRIAPDLSLLEQIPEPQGSASSIIRSGSSTASDLVLGNQVFGLKLSRRSLLILIVILVLLTAGSVTAMILMNRPVENTADRANEFRSLE